MQEPAPRANGYYAAFLRREVSAPTESDYELLIARGPQVQNPVIANLAQQGVAISLLTQFLNRDCHSRFAPSQ